MMKFFSSVLSDLCWCFLLFISWTAIHFTLFAIKRTDSHKMMMMMMITNYSHWLQQGLTPPDRLPHGFFRQTSIGAASEARCLSLSGWIVIWCIYNCAMYVIWEICWVFNLRHSFISLNCRRYSPLSLSLMQAWIKSHLRCSSLAMSRVRRLRSEIYSPPQPILLCLVDFQRDLIKPTSSNCPTLPPSNMSYQLDSPPLPSWSISHLNRAWISESIFNLTLPCLAISQLPSS